MEMLGLSMMRLGEMEQAIDFLEMATQTAPQQRLSHHNLGIAYREHGKLDAAEAALRHAITLDPQATDSLSSLGNVLRAKKQYTEAIALHQRATSLNPNDAELWSNLGTAHQHNKQYKEAEAAFENALTLEPKRAELHYNYGNTLLADRQLENAEQAFLAALTLEPTHPKAMTNLGSALREQGKHEAAQAMFRKVLERDPDDADAHFNLALGLLYAGDFQEGFAEYEWRRHIPEIPMRRYAKAQWQGEPLPGGTLLIHAEQGFGDTIQFARFIAWAKERCGRVLLECHAPLLELLRELEGVDELIARGATIPTFDRQTPLMSLPYLMKATAKDLAPKEPYVQAEPLLRKKWAARKTSKALHIGIGWQGNPSYKADFMRSAPLRHFAPLAAMEEVQLYSLQKGHGVEQMQAVPFSDRIENIAPKLDLERPFVDTAAFLSELDLVICTDTALPHLAGSLGCEVWLMLCLQPDWRWGGEGTSTPWYSKMTLFRQKAAGDWQGVMQDICSALAERLDVL